MFHDANYRRLSVKFFLAPWVGIMILFIIFFSGFLVWWSLMSAFFSVGRYIEALITAFILPTIYVLVAIIAGRKAGYYAKLLHFVFFVIMTLLFFLVLILLGKFILVEPAAWLGMAFIALVMALMQYPMAGLTEYEAYKTPWFLAGVIFMPLFIYFVTLLPNTPSTDKIILFPLGMIGFWFSGAWLTSRKAQGSYVPKLEIQPLMPFRPDFILPGGVLYVKGTIMMGVGLMILIHPLLGVPKWNWWGFVLAFWGIITLIPLRGMYKMVKGRRKRMLGKGGIGFKEEFYKGMILFIGLNILLYGFVNAFFGTTPFQILGVTKEFNAILGKKWLTALFGLTMFIVSFIIVVIIRGYYKIKLLEGVESTQEMITKQLLLYLGTFFLLSAYIHLLYLPPIRDLGIFWIYPFSNPLGFAVGSLLFLAGSILILVFRPIALKNEFEATVETFVGVIADSPDQIRKWAMENRIRTLARLPEKQRDYHVKLMLRGLSELPKQKKRLMMITQMEVLSSLESQERQQIMKSMDKAMLEEGEM